jgi:branched-chain amino acid transport system permease protein
MLGFAQNVIDGLSIGSIYALAALGVGLLFGVIRLINFAHGDFIAFGAYALIVPSTNVTAQMFLGYLPWPLLTLVICCLVVILSLLCDFFVFRHLRKASAATLMVASFSVGYIIQNTLMAIYGSRPKGVDLWSAINIQVSLGDLHVPLLQLITILATLALMAVLSAFLRLTSFGLALRAAAENFAMARYLGVRSNLVIGVAFAISAALAGTVSLLFLAQTGALDPVMAVPLLLFAFISTVVGGLGSLRGAVLGGFVIGMISSLLQAYLPPDLRNFKDGFVFSAVILILVFRPAGLFPTDALVERV